MFVKLTYIKSKPVICHKICQKVIVLSSAILNDSNWQFIITVIKNSTLQIILLSGRKKYIQFKSLKSHFRINCWSVKKPSPGQTQ